MSCADFTSAQNALVRAKSFYHIPWLPSIVLLAIVVSMVSLDERQKPGFLLIGGGHLPNLCLCRVTEFCTATEKTRFLFDFAIAVPL